MKHILYKLLLFPLLLVCGCQRDYLQENTDPGCDKEEVLASVNRNRIPSDIVNLETEDAVKVAKTFLAGRLHTRTGDLHIKSVVPITGSDDSVLYYAVNLSDGFLIVSARKNTYPIYAFSESGEFTGESSGMGLDVLVSEYRTMAGESSNSKDSLMKYKVYWSDYEEILPLPATKATVSPDYYDVLDPYLAEWFRDGYTVCYLYDKPEEMPDDMYASFCEYAEMGMGNLPGYPYMQCCIITYKTYPESDKKEPLLSTKWNQRSPFNSSDPRGRYLGCTTIAAGQIMRYHKFPQLYPGTGLVIDWDSMPDNTSNTVLSDFLYRLRTDIGVDDGGGATIDDVKRAMTAYRYSCEIISHNVSSVRSRLLDGNPVYMRGTDPATGDGHAWVCDGFYNSASITEYNLYVLEFKSQGVPFRMALHDTKRIYSPGLLFYHMNWGWGGSHNGYFVDYAINTSNGNFSTARKEILISK